MTFLAVALIVVGVLVTSLGVRRLIATNGLTRTTGEVLGHSARGSFLQPYAHASFRFTAADGTAHDIWSPDGSSVGPSVGNQVTIAYDPTNPSAAHVESPIGRFALFFVGDAFLLAGILLLTL